MRFLLILVTRLGAPERCRCCRVSSSLYTHDFSELTADSSSPNSILTHCSQGIFSQPTKLVAVVASTYQAMSTKYHLSPHRPSFLGHEHSIGTGSKEHGERRNEKLYPSTQPIVTKSAAKCFLLQLPMRSISWTTKICSETVEKNVKNICNPNSQ